MRPDSVGIFMSFVSVLEKSDEITVLFAPFLEGKPFKFLRHVKYVA